MIALIYILLPFCILSVGVITEGQQISFVLAALLFLAMQVRDKAIRTFLFYLCAWTVVISFLVLAGKLDNIYIARSFNLVLFSLAGMALYTYVAKNKSKEYWYNAICIGALLQCGLCLFQAFGQDPFFDLYGKIVHMERKLAVDAIVGTLANQNFISAFLVISIPFFNRKWWRLGLLPMVPVLILAQTSTAIVALMVGVAYYFRMVRVVRIPVVPIAATLAALLFILCSEGANPVSLFIRIDFWKESFRQVWENGSVLFGLGPNAPWGRGFPLHSEWVKLFHGFGLLGVGIIGYYFITAYRKDEILYTAFLIACVNALGNSSLHGPPTAFLILIILGLLERGKYGVQRNIR